MNIENLKAAGFVETTYEGQEGVFWTKRMSLKDMPYYKEHMVDNDLYFESDIAIIECAETKKFPKGGVQMVLEEIDYIEEMVAVDSEEGISLLKQAGAVVQ